jgi:hypothetical protein
MDYLQERRTFRIATRAAYICDSSTTVAICINTTIINKDYDEYHVWNSQMEAHAETKKILSLLMVLGITIITNVRYHQYMF